MFNAVIDSVTSGGVNIIDTAINYRYMKSERSIAAALKYLIENKSCERNQLFICSKAGYVPEDADQGIPGQVLIKNLIEKKVISEEDFVGACHCMHPNFLEHQLESTLNNLGIETLDLYYLQNAAETQLPLIGEEKFFDRLAKSFEFFEGKISQGKIKSYGLATWLCFREKPETTGIYLSLEKVMETAKKVGGEKHGLKYIQIPINIMMPEAFLEIFQEYTENGVRQKERTVSLARKLKVNLISCSPLLQGTLMQLPMPSEIFKCKNLGAKHLQFIRSIPAESLLSTLVGQKKNRHTKMNLEIIGYPPLTPEEFWSFLIPPNVRKPTPDEPINLQ